MALAEGSRVFLCYDLPPPVLWHERLVLSTCRCGRGWHIVLTPDGDVYPELISLENEDITGFRVQSVMGILPHGLSDANTYRIRQVPVGPEMEQMRIDARHAGDALAFPPGAGPQAGAMAQPVVPPGRAPGDGGDSRWLYVETVGEHQRGEPVTLDGSELIRGTVGLKLEGANWAAIRQVVSSEVAEYPGKEASSDARLLNLSFQNLGREERVWRDVARDSREETFEDWNLPGPRTASWCIKYLNRRQGGPMDHHRWWVSTNGLQTDSWGVQEHEGLMKALDKLARFDGLDLSDLAGVELIFRRLQMIEYFHSEKAPGGGKGSGKNKEKKSEDGTFKAEAAIFTGTHRDYGDVMIDPNLLEFVSKEVERDAAVMKQMRKAREERAAASK